MKWWLLVSSNRTPLAEPSRAYRFIQASIIEDLDVLVSFDDGKTSRTGLVTSGPILSYLADRGYTEFSKEGIVIEGWPVQFLPVADDLDREALSAAVVVEEVLGVGSPPTKLRVLTAEHLAATTLKVGRPKDEIRLTQFVEEGVLDMDVFRVILARHGLEARWQGFCDRSGLNTDPTGKAMPR